MTHYAVSQLVKLIQENLYDPRYYDISKYDIERQLRKLIQDEQPKRYPPVTKLSKYSLDEEFKDRALQLLTDFNREPRPTEKELLLKDLDVVALEDGTNWFKLSKLYHALEHRGVIPNDLSDRKFWINAHKRLEPFEHIYIRTINPYTRYPNVAVIHYKEDDIVEILKQLNIKGVIQCDQLIEDLKR